MRTLRDVGWVYEIVGNGVQRLVSVTVADGELQSRELPEDAWRAVTTHGWSAVDAVLDHVEPPLYLIVSGAGVRPRK